jgi:hypothetical protein
MTLVYVKTVLCHNTFITILQALLQDTHNPWTKVLI